MKVSFESCGHRSRPPSGDANRHDSNGKAWAIRFQSLEPRGHPNRARSTRQNGTERMPRGQSGDARSRANRPILPSSGDSIGNCCGRSIHRPDRVGTDQYPGRMAVSAHRGARALTYGFSQSMQYQCVVRKCCRDRRSGPVSGRSPAPVTVEYSLIFAHRHRRSSSDCATHSGSPSRKRAFRGATSSPAVGDDLRRVWCSSKKVRKTGPPRRFTEGDSLNLTGTIDTACGRRCRFPLRLMRRPAFGPEPVWGR